MRQLLSVDVFTHRGFSKVDQPNRGNEDRFAIGSMDTLFGVIDGATSVVKHDMDGLTPAAYLARYVSGMIGAQNVPADDMTALDVFLFINSSFGRHLKTSFPVVAAEGKYGPSAAAVMVKLHADNTYSYAQVADCFLVEVRTDGTTVLLTPDQLLKLDGRSMAEAKNRLRDGVPPEEILADPKVRAILKANRLLNNVTFGVINGEDAVADMVCSGRRSLEGVAALVLMSDGMVMPGTKRENGAEVAASEMIRHGVSTYYRQLKALYDADPTFTEHLRFKHMDDATGMVLRLI